MCVAKKSFRDGVILILSTGYSIGCAAAIVLNTVIPNEAADEELPTVAVPKVPGAGVQEEKFESLEVATDATGAADTQASRGQIY